MTRIQRPTDDRTSNDLLCWEQPGTPIDEPASCPLLKTVHLLPIRYGRVEVAPAETDPGYPYSLTSRPIGYRLLRHGYLYVLDADAGELHEYLHEDGELTEADAVLAQRLAHHRPHRQVGHVMVVHDIEMDDVGPRRQHVLDLLPQTGEVGGENGGIEISL